MAGTFLRRTPSSAGNRKTWTFSAWIKRSDTASEVGVLNAQPNSSNYTRIRFGSNKLRVLSVINGGTGSGFDKETSRVFRDNSAFYNIVIAYNSTLVTSNDRVKIWVNGVLETDFSINSFGGGQNLDSFVNATNLHDIGAEESASYFNGLMSHIHLIDGTAYDATAFGQYDANGVWTIKTSPSVTYGTNGFFILKDSGSKTDQSGNSNNFSEEGTPGIVSDTQDSPSNVFATLNPLDNPYVGQIATFSNGNTTGQSTETGYLSGASTIGVSTGKYYVEIKPINGDVALSGIGVMTDPISDLGSTPIHDSGKLYGIRGNGTKITGSSTTSSWSGSYTTNDILGLALDLDNNRLYISKNGQYADGLGNFDEAFTGSPAYVTLASNQTYFFVGGSLSTGSGRFLTIQANFGNGYFGTTAVASAGTNASGIGIFEYDVPTGYTALSTKGLNL